MSRARYPTALALGLLLLPGCLTVEVTEYRVRLEPDGRRGAVLVSYRSIESDAGTSEERSRDFEDLLDYWKGDEALFDRLADGFYLKERQLAVENRKVVAREVLLFSDPGRIFADYRPGQPLRIRLAAKDQPMELPSITVTAADRITSDGRTDRSGRYLVWPAGTRAIWLRAANHAFRPTTRFADTLAARGIDLW